MAPLGAQREGPVAARAGLDLGAGLCSCLAVRDLGKGAPGTEAPQLASCSLPGRRSMGVSVGQASFMTNGDLAGMRMLTQQVGVGPKGLHVSQAPSTTPLQTTLSHGALV